VKIVERYMSRAVTRGQAILPGRHAQKDCTGKLGRSRDRPAAKHRPGPHREGEEPEPMVHGNGKFVGEDREEMMELRALSSAVAIVVTLGACASGPPESAVSSSLAVANDAINHARTDGALEGQG
jgi:hypothetical protein